MSTALSLSPNGGYIAVPNFAPLIPSEGPRAVFVLAPFSQGVTDTYAIDFRDLVESGKMADVASLFVDNWIGTTAVTISVEGTSFQIVIPPGTQGWYTVLAITIPRFTVVSEGSTDVRLQFHNSYIAPIVWTNEAGATGTVTVTGTVAVAGTVDTLPVPETPVAALATEVVTAGTAVTVFNGSINNGLIQNPGTGTLFVAFGTNAGTVAGGGTFALSPGAAIDFGAVTGSITANAITNAYTFAAVGNVG